MTIRDTSGRLFQPGLIADIPSGNLVWVDPINGNDDMAVRGRMTVPFKTLTKAKTAAASGDTIVVLPGEYNEKNLLKNNVNWHFLPGAIVRYTGETGGGIFDTSANGTNGAVISLVTGWGVFRIENSQSSGHIVYSAVSNSDLTIHARSMAVTSAATCVKAAHSTGKLRVYVTEDIKSNTGKALDISGTASSSNENLIRAHRLYTSAGPGAYVGGGNLDLAVQSIQALSDGAVSIEGGTGSNIIIRAYEIIATASAAVIYNATSNPTLTIIGARINCLYSNSTGHSLYVAAGGSDKIKLAGCVLLSNHASSKSIETAGSTTVQCHGLSVGQRVKGGSVTPVPSGGWIDSVSVS